MSNDDGSRRARHLILRGLLLTLFSGWAGGLAAQSGGSGQAAPPRATVIGRVLDAETRAPQEGVFVVALDEAGRRHAGVLADATGRFVLRVPAPGRFRLRAERIGLESGFSPWFDTGTGQVVTIDLSTRPMAVSLEGVEVTGASRCGLRGDQGSATIRLWEEARKVLEVAEWVDEAGYVYDTRSFERVLGPAGRRVIEESSRVATRVGAQAFQSLDADSLAARGFVQGAGEGQTFYAPDARVLLSDAFLSTHCFEAVREEGRVGLAFRPTPDRLVSEIDGTLWFREGGGLDEIEFEYIETRTEFEGSPLGGRIVFEQLEGGEWIVAWWSIRMPHRAETRVAPDRMSRRLELVSMREVGGEVRSVRAAERMNAIMSPRRGAVRGRGFDEATGAPLSGAEVYLSGTSYAAVAAGDGTFLIERARPGLYQLILDHPLVSNAGENGLVVEVEVVRDSVAVVELGLPSRDELVRARCSVLPLLDLEEPDRRDAAPSAVGGVVLDAEGRPRPDWPVRVRWSRSEVTASGDARESWRGTVAFTGPRGGWAVCGLPEDLYVTVEAAEETLTAEEASGGRGEWRTRAGVGILRPGSARWIELRTRSRAVNSPDPAGSPDPIR